ncbi:MAG: NAD(P)/FAD-dependent oxidoreductase [Acidimicrobiales bacterium]
MAARTPDSTAHSQGHARGPEEHLGTLDPVAIIGAGPAGLTAAYQLGKAGRRALVLEADAVVGGISRTVERDGWRFDLGGHRFFTKVPAVEDLWREILPAEDMLLRPRMSRIYYNGKFYDYPLRAVNALKNLGLREAVLCGCSYLWARVHPPRDQSNYEGWLVARFGWRLYRTFFRTYTEKVWGVPVSEMPADWAAQRVKNLDLGKAVANALRPRRNQKAITSLIEEFHYPRLGPGMMWERCRDLVVAGGGTVLTRSPVEAVHVHDGRAVAVTYRDAGGNAHRLAVSHVISSAPMRTLVAMIDPAVPPEVLAAGEDLHYRDFLTVALIVPESKGFPDNWIYIHAKEVQVGRIQNFGSWSPSMVKEGRTCLGLEYFVFEGDQLWESSDDVLVEMATRELVTLGLVGPGDVEAGYATRIPKAYPHYDHTYQGNVSTIVKYLATVAPNIHLVGRNGMHKYNNQDHSMYTALLTVENILGASHDIWAVNVEEEYHEERTAPLRGHDGGTGRDAPVLPWRAPVG